MNGLGQFTLGRLLHDRGTVQLYRGTRNSDGSDVIIKLRVGVWGEDSQLRHEFHVLRDLDVPGVVRAIALVRGETGLALVLEPLPGKPLDMVLRERRLALATALEIAIAIVRALEGIHRAGVVHRDIKPANIMFDESTGQVSLIDFGIASKNESPVESGLLEGTLAYLAPEQTGRTGLRVDGRSDLYSLGVTLYEMLTGRLPFVETDPMALVHAHLAKVPAKPTDIDATIPVFVSDIVMRLLKKGPDERYQRAAGLLFDLETSLAEWRIAGRIELRAMGTRDVPADICSSRETVGREKEYAALLDAYARIAQNARAEVIVLEGAAGIGKSALVRHWAAEVLARVGRLGIGKCEQTGRSSPYAPMARALGEILRASMEDAPDKRRELQQALETALGPNVGILVRLVPDAEMLMGSGATVPALGAAETRHRLSLVLERTLQCLTQQQPLALFIDDVQWMSSGALELIEALVGGNRIPHLLVVFGKRNEATPAFDEMLLRAEKAAVVVQFIRLGPLDGQDTRTMIARALHSPAWRIETLADELHARTGGNPLFALTLLRTLHETNALRIDAETGAILADYAHIEPSGVGADVIALLEKRLLRLSARTRRVVVMAAILGSQFDATTLMACAGLSADETQRALDEAVREGFFLPVGTMVEGRWRFAHDRVQQAAFALVAEEERGPLELIAGRALRARASETARDEDLFAAVELLIVAIPYMHGQDERWALMRDLLHAGQRARACAAFATGRRYFDRGVGLLDDEHWAQDHALAFALLAELCECEASIGESEACKVHVAELERRARGRLDDVRVAAIHIQLHLRDGKNAEAALTGCHTLRTMGIDLPLDEDGRKAALDDVFRRDPEKIRIQDSTAWLARPDMTDPTARVIEGLLMAIALPAYFSSPNLYALVTSSLLDLYAHHGHSDVSAMAYAFHGAFVISLEGHEVEAWTFGKLALDLLERRPNSVLTCRVLETVGGNIAFLHEPVRDILGRFPAALQAGLDAGGLLEASYICGHTIPFRISIGDDLADVAEQWQYLTPIVDRAGDVFGIAVMRMFRRILWDLSGQSEPWIDDERLGEAALNELAKQPDFSTLAALRHTYRILAAIVREAWDEARESAQAAEAMGPYAPGQFFPTELFFFAAIARLESARQPDSGEGPLASHRKALRTYAQLCPASYLARHLLVEAEVVRVAGDELAAMRLYDEAISATEENEMVRDEAIANERCAAFHLSRGRTRIARGYLVQALEAYRRWGAMGKVRRLENRLSRRLCGKRALISKPAWGDLTSTASVDASLLLDATAALRVAQAITSEVVTTRIVERLLRIIVEMAGAERAVVVEERTDEFVLTAKLEADEVHTGLLEALTHATPVATTIVRDVARTGQPAVLADATTTDRYARDSYILRRRPRSILCFALEHAGRRRGIIYLENNATRDAFSRERLEALGIVGAQAAIALENASLYENLTTAQSELMSTNARLADEVARQTKALEAELLGRVEAERARNVLSDEIIRVQRERMAEMSVPLLPIAEGIILVPIMGSMDAARAADVLEATISGAKSWSARVVLIDVTGMRGASHDVAQSLITISRTLRLLGTETMITGIRREMAREFVFSGAEFGGLLTRSTLRSGIAYALGRAPIRR